MGLTGSGKSTLLPTLLEDGRTLLPERREITDRVILPAAQRMEGVPPAPVDDRLERFRLTARYREEHPEGIVRALVQELTDQPLSGPAVFDGLRGEREVKAAVRRFPDARFLMLLARPLTRVKRLMSRNDHFDQVSDQASEQPSDQVSDQVSGQVGDQVSEPGSRDRTASVGGALRRRIEGIEGANKVLDPAELVRCWQDQPERADDLLRAVRIVVAEQRHYGDEAARTCLERLPPQRSLVVDSEELGPAQVAERVRSWLSASDHE